jgi:beta-lactam-binding protein with PASTA domain
MSDDDRASIPGPMLEGTHPSPPLVPLTRRAGLPGGGACPAPDLIGMGFLEAHGLAAAAGLRLSVSVWEAGVGPWGRVLDQQPPAGSRIRRGGRIGITVSGRPNEQVPDVRGQPLVDAIERLAWLGFVPLVDLRRPSPSVMAGHVVSTRPQSGTLLACGSVVALTVARAERGRGVRSAAAETVTPSTAADAIAP